MMTSAEYLLRLEINETLRIIADMKIKGHANPFEKRE